MPLIEDQFDDTLTIVRRTGQELAAAPRIWTTGHHPADVTQIRSAVLEQFGLDTVILDCRGVSVTDGVVHRQLTLESLDDTSARSDITWVSSRDALPPIDGRDWTVPGWWARATAWITDTLQAAGLGRITAIDQLRTWEFSCVLRVQTEQQELYFKALPRSYAHEPQLARFLANRHPGFVPGVVAINQTERWSLMQACRGQCLEEGAPLGAWERAAAGYAELQVASAAQVAHLETLGCPVRGPHDLRTTIGPLLADEPALRGPGEHGLSLQEWARLRNMQPGFEAACDELAASNLPLALEHGDLWSSNVYVADTDVQFIDWTDASIAHPFFSLMPLLQSLHWDQDPATVPALQARVMNAYLERWTAFAPRTQLHRALSIALPLAALHIATTYWRDIPQPHHQWWMPRMVPFFLRMALWLVDGVW